MLDKILTIVVPTYNAEKYLRDNLESFCISELLDDLEVLIINDGSTDNSAQIAEEYVQRYPDTYRLISKENGGHGSGINAGIKYAAGRYFKVVDADDWVEQKAFLELVRFLKNNNSDVVYSGFLWVYDKGQKDKNEFEKKAEFEEPFRDVVYEKEYMFDEIALKAYIKMHNVTIKTSILRDHNIHIDEHCYYVDTEYITYPIPFVKTISFLPSFVYMYRLGSSEQSVSMEKMQKNEENYDKVLGSLFDFYKKLGGDIECSIEKKKYIANIIARVVAGKIKILLSFPASAEKKQELVLFDAELKKEFPEIYQCNVNKSVAVLRSSNYLMYNFASKMVRRKYG